MTLSRRTVLLLLVWHDVEGCLLPGQGLARYLKHRLIMRAGPAKQPHNYCRLNVSDAVGLFEKRASGKSKCKSEKLQEHT